MQHFSLLENAELGKMSKNKKKKREEPFSRVQIRPENAKMGTKPKAVERGFVCVYYFPIRVCCAAWLESIWYHAPWKCHAWSADS